MSQIVLYDIPRDRHRTPAQLAVQEWLKGIGPDGTVNTWDKKKKANAKKVSVPFYHPRLRAAVVVDKIKLEDVVVEYPVVMHGDNTFTTIIILPLKGDQFLVDQRVPFLTASEFMANNKGKSVQDERLGEEMTLEDVVAFATRKNKTRTVSAEYDDYLFVKEAGKESWLLLLLNQQSLYKAETILRDIFGDYLPWSVTATLKEDGDGLLSEKPESLDACYVGTITVTERVVPDLTTINLINIPLIASFYRDKPVNYDGQFTYDGTQTYLGQSQ